jgi:hypothetical protein
VAQDEKGRFLPGNKGPRARRPKGALNTVTTEIRDRMRKLDGDVEAVMRSIIKSRRLFRERPEVLVKAYELTRL